MNDKKTHTQNENPAEANSKLSIVLLIVYFGYWPKWFASFLRSCQLNSTITWIIFSDCDVDVRVPENVKIIPFTQDEFSLLVSKKLKIDYKLEKYYKLCDFKPAYGDLFDSYIEAFDYWGHCDIDLIWGRIRHFITDEILTHYDIISSRKNCLSGHFNLYRNNSAINSIYQQVPGYLSLLTGDAHAGFDECAMTRTVFRLQQKNKVRVKWDAFMLNFNHHTNDYPSNLGKIANRWLWEKGAIFDLGSKALVKREVMYLHFMTWKDSLKFCEFHFSDAPDSFYISYNGITKQKAELSLIHRLLLTVERELFKCSMQKHRLKSWLKSLQRYF